MRLGVNQRSTLESLVKFGFWPSGFLYAHYSTTVRIMDSLVKRGLARKDTDGKYRPTDAGLSAIGGGLDADVSTKVDAALAKARAILSQPKD